MRFLTAILSATLATALTVRQDASAPVDIVAPDADAELPADESPALIGEPVLVTPSPSPVAAPELLAVVHAAAASAAAADAKTADKNNTHCPADPKTQRVNNPGFESGGGAYVQSPGAEIRNYTPDNDGAWPRPMYGGQRYMYLESSKKFRNSTFSQEITGLKGRATLMLDWSFLLVSSTRGPPDTTCTLSTGFAIYDVVASWSRPGKSGGHGAVHTTFDTGVSGGTLTFTFVCSSVDNYVGQAAVDNLFIQTCD